MNPFRFCLLLSLLALPALGQAAQWARLSGGAGKTFYIDKSSVTKVDTLRKVWTMQSFGKEQTTPDGKAYRSLKELHLYSCEERTTTLLSQVYYPDAMGKGEPVGNFKYERFAPEDVVPDSAYDSALTVVCKQP